MKAAETLRIGFKRHLRVEPGPDGVLYLISVGGVVALSGERFQTLAPFLDGTRTLAEILESTAPHLSEKQVRAMLERLTERNLIGHRAQDRGGDAAAGAYWDLAGAPTDLGGGVGAPVNVVAFSGIDPGPIVTACLGAGLDVREGPGEGASTFLVCCEDYLDPALADFNESRLADGGRWLLAKPTGPGIWVGPAFCAGVGPCWSCLAVRLRGHRRGESYLRRELESCGSPRPPDASLPMTRALGAHLAVLEMAKRLAGIRRVDPATVWTLDTVSLEAAHHRVDRRPQCGACGDTQLIQERARRPIVTGPRPKAETRANGHRALPAEQVWERYRHLSDPITGIMDGIRRDPRSPAFLPCYLSGPNLAQSSMGSRAGLRHSSSGKGCTELEAKVGALCEAVERYCGSRLGDESTVRDSFRGLGAQAVHPDTCQLFHPRQYADRERWNATNMPFQHVPERFDEREAMEWTPIWSLISGNQRFLPTDLLYFNAGRAHPALRANSNGNAAGSSIEDAIIQGFLELVERDAVALWWYNRTRQPAVDLHSMDDPWITRLGEVYARLNRKVWVLDVTSDLGIPVMTAVSRRVDKPEQDIMLGFGAHFDPQIAVRRALTELGQLLPAVIEAGVSGAARIPEASHLWDWWRTATTVNQPYLLPDPELEPRRRDDYAYVRCADLGDDVDRIRDLVHGLGLDVFVLDQTRDDIDMPVVKVIVPGLRHFWARFAPGRLYDVPVRLGRVGATTAYEQLNPIPLFL